MSKQFDEGEEVFFQSGKHTLRKRNLIQKHFALFWLRRRKRRSKKKRESEEKEREMGIISAWWDFIPVCLWESELFSFNFYTGRKSLRNVTSLTSFLISSFLRDNFGLLGEKGGEWVEGKSRCIHFEKAFARVLNYERKILEKKKKVFYASGTFIREQTKLQRFWFKSGL